MSAAAQPAPQTFTEQRPAPALDWRDVLFAATTVLAVSGLNHGHSKVPLFGIAVVILAISNMRLLSLRYAVLFLNPPLLMFLLWHHLSAFRDGVGPGIFFIAQAFIDEMFVWLLVTRYAFRPMTGYLRAAGVGVLILLAYVIGWHISHHVYFSWKRLTDAKVVFDILPVLLVVARNSRDPLTRRLFPLLLIISTVAILLSGERKAYILLALIAPLIINFRNPLVYILPALALIAAPLAMAVDKEGYVSRQVHTLVSFSQGKVDKTMSNEGRSDGMGFAIRTFVSHPIIGVGTNREIKLVQSYFPDYPAPHNEWLRIAAENGIVGLFFYAWTIALSCLGLLRKQVLGRVRTPAEQRNALALMGMLLLYISFEAFDYIVMLAFLMIPFVQYLRLDSLAPERAPLGASEPSPPRRAPRRVGGPATIS